MTSHRLLRRGTPIWTVAALAAYLLGAAACGSADDAETGEADGGEGGGEPTGGSSGTGAAGEGGFAGDAGVAGSAGSSGNGGFGGGSYFVANPAAAAVHASPDLFPFRLCAELNGSFPNEYPFPYGPEHHVPEASFPGIPPGGTVDLDPLLDELNYQGPLTLHLVRADSLRVARAIPEYEDEGCRHLLDPNGTPLAAGDVISFDNVAFGDPVATPVRVLLVQGCGAHNPPNPDLSESLCGTGYQPASGNRTLQLIEFSPALYTEPTTTNVYAFHVSPSLAAMQANTIELRYGDLASDGDMTAIANVPAGAPEQDPGAITAPADVAAYGTAGFALWARGTANGDQKVLEASLADVQRASAPYTTPEAFFTGTDGLLMLILGDATDQSEPWLASDGTWNDAYDGRGVHILALPFDFEL